MNKIALLLLFCTSTAFPQDIYKAYVVDSIDIPEETLQTKFESFSRLILGANTDEIVKESSKVATKSRFPVDYTQTVQISKKQTTEITTTVNCIFFLVIDVKPGKYRLSFQNVLINPQNTSTVSPIEGYAVDVSEIMKMGVSKEQAEDIIRMYQSITAEIQKKMDEIATGVKSYILLQESDW